MKVNKNFKCYESSDFKVNNYVNSVKFKEMTKSVIEKLKTDSISRNSIKKRVEELTEILIKVSTKCLKFTKNRHKSSKPNQKKYFDTDCYNMRREVRRLAIILSKSPQNIYKKKVKKRNFKEMTLERLNNLKPFEIKKKWELIKTLTNSKDTNDPAKGISIDRWKTYFEKLSKSEETHDKLPDHVFEKLCTSENIKLTDEKVRSLRNELNKLFQKKDIKLGIPNLKSGKSVGIDNVKNEIIKCCLQNEKFIEAIEILNNRIIDQSVYPELWKKYIIKPVHKKK